MYFSDNSSNVWEIQKWMDSHTQPRLSRVRRDKLLLEQTPPNSPKTVSLLLYNEGDKKQPLIATCLLSGWLITWAIKLYLLIYLWDVVQFLSSWTIPWGHGQKEAYESFFLQGAGCRKGLVGSTVERRGHWRLCCWARETLVLFWVGWRWDKLGRNNPYSGETERQLQNRGWGGGGGF